MKQKTGFTLIELLVVIAIIGILSGVVLAALGNARSKGNDASVKSNLVQIVNQAAIYITDNPNYGTYDDGSFGPLTCPAPSTAGATVFHDPKVEEIIASAVTASAGGTSYCVSSTVSYAVAVGRPVGSPSGAWCVDSIGTKCGVATTSPMTNGLCTIPCVSAN